MFFLIFFLLIYFFLPLGIDISSDGKFLISVSDDRSLVLWKIEEENYSKKVSKICKISNLHERTIYSCSINFNDKLIATVKIFIF